MAITINEVRYVNTDGERETATFTAFYDGVSVRGSDPQLPTVDIAARPDDVNTPAGMAVSMARLFAYAVGERLTGLDRYTV